MLSLSSLNPDVKHSIEARQLIRVGGDPDMPDTIPVRAGDPVYSALMTLATATDDQHQAAWQRLCRESRTECCDLLWRLARASMRTQ